MCGLTGFIHSSNGEHRKPELERVIEKMTSTLVLRGPDSKGIFIDKKIALGHRRLKIIDLSDNGSQPMQVRENGPVIAYNGEVYNFQLLKNELSLLGHSFRGNSDTEVILHVYDEWGFDGLKRLEGIFAYALWDPSIDRLMLMRDRLGVKPIFYADSSMGLVFGSEIKSLLAAGGVDTSLNDQAFSEYLWYGNTYEDRSFYNGVKALLPGQCLIVDGNNRRLVYWWKIEEWLESPLGTSNKDDATDMVKQALDASVKRQLVADVPIGIFLSGGVDSSAIAASAKQSRLNDINSYSASFDFDKGIDESEKALLVATHLGLNHHQLKISGSNISEVMLLLAKAHDEPFADAANIPLYLMCKELDPAVKVVLQGDGGDELFAGYRRYQILNNAKYFKFLPPYLSSIFTKAGKQGYRASRMYDAITNPDPAMRMGMLLTVETLRNNPNTLLTEDKRHELDLSTDPFLAYRHAADRFKVKDPIQQMLLTDLTVQLPSQFLTKVDRATMAAGIEARVPLLDENLLKISVGMPTKWKVDRNQNKIILRNSQRGRLPSSILDGPKTGFGVPYEFWLRTSLYKFAQDRLLNTQFTEHFSLNKSLVEKKLQEHRSGKFEHGFLLWKLLQLSLWMETRD
jgi:asparagine synthase (glutamine-hydrolysing)